MKIILTLVLLGTVSNTFAAESSMETPLPSQTSVKVSSDIDDEITNARLRAVTGAKSNYSFWSQTVFLGSSLSAPLQTPRPQLNPQNGADPVNFSSQVGGKYRVSENDSLIAGIGLQYTPAYPDPRRGGQPTTTTMSQPYVDYSRAFRWGGYQNVVDVAISKYTLPADQDAGLNLFWSMSHQLIVELPSVKKLSLGFASFLGQDIYNTVRPKGSFYLGAGFDPVLEYALTEKLSFRTMYFMLSLSEISGEENLWKQSQQTESAGVGYAVTRDIYLYPNVGWMWGHMSADQTTVGLSANINL